MGEWERRKAILGSHPCVSQGNESPMNSFLFQLGGNSFKGPTAFRPGFAQVVV